MESFMAANYSGPAGYCRPRSSTSRRVTASARAESADSDAWRSAWVGACSRRFVRVLARYSMTSSADLPAVSRRRACSRVCCRMASACWRSARMAGAASLPRDSVRKARHFLTDQGPRAVRGHFTRLSIFIDQLLQVVDGKEVDVLQVRNRRIDIPRDRQIDHENRPAAPRPDGGGGRILVDEGHGARGCS